MILQKELKLNNIAQDANHLVKDSVSNNLSSNSLNQVIENKTFFLIPLPKVVKGYNSDSSYYFNETKQDFGYFLLPHFEVSQTLKTVEYQNNKLNYHNYGIWILFILFISLALLSWIQSSYNQYLDRIIKAVFSKQISSRLFKDSTPQLITVNLVLNLFTLVNLSSFVVLMLNYYNYASENYSNLYLFSTIGILILLLIGAKIKIISFLGSIFAYDDLADEYTHRISIYNKSFGVFIFPLIIILPFVNNHFGEVIVLIGFFLLVFLYLMLLVRGIRIIFSKHVRIFYLILYFCGLEILPVLILFKSVKSLIY